ncbi:MAG TPA: 2-dehydropantoate 2-reductase [Casimicrobiaceae bacterium]|nr:2-dehydropantoate 2-reductase [Casimicrobiaceae bacterium]
MTQHGDPTLAPRCVAVVGAGAVGGYFGAVLARAGAAVTFLARAAQAEAIERDGLMVSHASGEWRAPVRATTRPADVADADLLLVAVKSQDTEGAITGVKPHLRSDARILSMQNGVDNAARIAAQVANPVYAAVVYVGADTEAPGRIRHNGRGDLVLGLPLAVPRRGDARRDLDAISGMFERAGVRCPVSENIDGALWTKLTLNCAYNAISAIANLPYGAMVQSPEIRAVMEECVRETVRVADAEGVGLAEEHLIAAVHKLVETMPDQYSSTAQDVQRGKPTEIDAINGYVAARGRAHGIPAPVNQTLHALVKLRERQYVRNPVS